MRNLVALVAGAWLALAVLALSEPAWYWSAVGVAAIATLWYLPFGTVIGVVLLSLSIAQGVP